MIRSNKSQAVPRIATLPAWPQRPRDLVPVIAVQPLETRKNVASQGRVSMPDMRRVVHTGDGSCDVAAALGHDFLRSGALFP